MNPEILARLDSRLRPFVSLLPSSLAVRFYSRGRRHFLGAFSSRPPRRVVSPEGLERVLWGLRFRSPILNAAGMWKNGDGYDVTWRQGAGAYLAGTTTHRPRRGNRRRAVSLPFVPYPSSGAASNWLGLPNLGHREVARRLAALPRHEGFPIGASVAVVTEDGDDEAARLESWIAGLRLYEEAGADFLEINESCPNTEDGATGFGDLERRLAVVRDRFLGKRSLTKRSRPLPVVVKFSCDTALEQVPGLVALLLELGFDGVNFGNTSTAYVEHRDAISAAERPLYDHFTETYGGGLSGRPLKETSLALAAVAVAHVREHPPEREFHVIRTGGIEDTGDLRRSEDAGVVLNQWYSGYFEAFSRGGHGLYRELYRALDRSRAGG